MDCVKYSPEHRASERTRGIPRASKPVRLTRVSPDGFRLAQLATMLVLLFFLQSCARGPTPAPAIVPPTPTTAPPPSPTATPEPSEPALTLQAPTPQPIPTVKFYPPPAIHEAGQVWTNSIDGSGMVGVPAGEFPMGSNKGTAAEGPVHTVYIDAYYIDRYEVTNAQYRLCVEAGECHKLEKPGYYDDPAFDQHPVVNVTWHWANTYCDWVRERLPTEAEWEKAARGTDRRIYPWGEGIDCDHAQYKDCGGQTEAAVSNPDGASPYGAVNMAGNVWEWVIDDWQEDYYQESPADNPQGPANPRNIVEMHVFRGGSWSEPAELLRSSYRIWYEPDAQYYNLGFRCVIDAP